MTVMERDKAVDNRARLRKKARVCDNRAPRKRKKARKEREREAVIAQR
jgi:hypothetical protein